MGTQSLFDRYYFSRPSFVAGTEIFHRMCHSYLGAGADILEIGAGPANGTSQFLSQIGTVTGLDMSKEVLNNPHLAHAYVYDGVTMPFRDDSFDICVSNYVLEHITNPFSHFSEVARILKPNGTYCFRTPNLWHYVTISSKLLPHAAHLRIANKLRGLSGDAHDPWPTVYRANTCRILQRLANKTGLLIEEIRMIEAEPSYGAFHAILFYPMMVYERVVNSSELFRTIRVNILGSFRKPGLPQSHVAPDG
jgi:SAM-dependent methyltransferase